MDKEQPDALIQALVKVSKGIQTCRDTIRVHGRKTSPAVRELLARSLKLRRRMLRCLVQYGPSWRIDVRDVCLYHVAMWLRYLILVVGILRDVVLCLRVLHRWPSLGDRAPPGSRRAWPVIPALIQRQ
jgi:hypothetical protein